jgi:yitT family protein
MGRALTKKVDTTRLVKEYAMIVFGLIIYTMGWTCFLVPMKVTGGGASGIGTMVYLLTGGAVPVGVTYLLVNIILIAIAMKVIGANFGVKTIFAVGLASVLLYVEQLLLKPYVPIMPNDILLSAIIGGVMSGLGIAIAFSQGGSTGGTDIIVMLVLKYRNMSPGKVLLMVDVIIVSSALFSLHDLSFTQRIAQLMYGYITMVTTSYVIDLYLNGRKQSLQVLIFSKNYASICDRINTEMHRGVSVLDAVGWYTKEGVKVLLVVVRSNEKKELYRIIKEEDKSAFITAANVSGGFGQGFESIRP